jgi:hypothetical protein
MFWLLSPVGKIIYTRQLKVGERGALEEIRALPVATRRALAGDLEQLVDKVDLEESWNVWCCIYTMGTGS